jgi:predicted nucleotidyltransferase
MFFDLSARVELAITSQTLAVVANVLARHATQWLLVGAAARDMVLSFGYGLEMTRATRDLDIGVAIPAWETFEKIATDLVDRAGFTRDTSMSHRFRTDGAVVDIVPFGAVATDGVLAWPPDGEFEMSVLGFRETYAASDEVLLPGQILVRVASPPGLLLLKMIAWDERHMEKPKHDAVDIAALLHTYSSKRALDDVYTNGADLLETFEYDVELVGAALMGRYSAAIAEPETAEEVLRILDRETDIDGWLLLASDMSLRSVDWALRLLEALRHGFRGEDR